MAQVYAAYQHRVVGFIAKHVMPEDRGDIEDLAQETFLRAWKSLGRVHATDEHLIGWLCGIAKHVIASHYRKQRAGRAVPTAPDAPVWSAATWPAGAPIGEAVHPSVIDLDAAVAELPELVRNAVTFRLAHGMPGTVVAAELHRDRRTVTRLVERGVAELRTRIGVAA